MLLGSYRSLYGDSLTVVDLPRDVSRHLDGWERVDDAKIGRSSARVLVFERDGRRRFVKASPASQIDGLRNEAERIGWLSAHVEVPAIVALHLEATVEYLITEGLPGTMACDPVWAGDLQALFSAVAAAMRHLHETPSISCPFDRSPKTLLDLAQRRIEAGSVDPADFGEEFRGRTPDQLLRRLRHRIPERFVPTVVHGDFSLPNVLVADGVGFVDLARSGVGDRHIDLAVAARSIAYNWGEQWVPRFFEAYGQFPDPERLAWYRMLDELL